MSFHFRQALPVETMGGSPMDMMQYYRLFGTTRIPAEGKDKMSFNPDSKHIVVLHRNHVRSRLGIKVVFLG